MGGRLLLLLLLGMGMGLRVSGGDRSRCRCRCLVSMFCCRPVQQQRLHARAFARLHVDGRAAGEVTDGRRMEWSGVAAQRAISELRPLSSAHSIN
jgi:hypothetical protein